jgi:prepilin-type N-terminal cleavage/methylation domain-containing protein
MNGAGRCSGFTLLELVVVIAVLGVLAGAISPAVVQRIVEARVESTREEAEAIHEAIVGRPAESVFGFVGDIGRFPATFNELAQQGGLPAFTTATVRNVGMGWRGPYVNTGTSSGDYLTDAFGRAYTGAATGQVRSAGPDGVVNNADDIVYPPAAPTIVGTLTITLKTTQGQKTIVDPAGYRADLYYASNGAQVSVSDAAAPFSFTNVPMGIHAVRIVKTSNPQAGSIVSEDTLFVRPGSSTAAELWF